MNEEKQKIIEKIQKCLILSQNDGATDGEKEAAKRQAALLMSKYRIEETEVDLEDHNFVYDVYEYYWDEGHCPQWVSRVLHIFSYIFDTKWIFRKDPFNEVTEFEIFGTFSDVETVMYFVEVACHHFDTEALKMFPKSRNWKKRQQFGNNATDALWQRAFELKEQMDQTIHEEEGCHALVVQKQDQVQKEIDEMYPNAKKSRSRKIDRGNDASTIKAGRKAGENCPLNFAID